MEKIIKVNSMTIEKEEDYLDKEIIVFLEEFLNKSFLNENIHCRVRTQNLYMEINRHKGNPKKPRLFLKLNHTEMREINEELRYIHLNKKITINQRHTLNLDKNHKLYTDKRYMKNLEDIKKIQDSYKIKEYEDNNIYRKFIENENDIKFYIEEVKNLLMIDKVKIKNKLIDLYKKQYLIIKENIKD